MNKKYSHMKFQILYQDIDMGAGTFREYGVYEIHYNSENEIIQIPNKVVSTKGNNEKHILKKLTMVLNDVIDSGKIMSYNELVKDIKNDRK